MVLETKAAQKLTVSDRVKAKIEDTKESWKNADKVKFSIDLAISLGMSVMVTLFLHSIATAPDLGDMFEDDASTTVPELNIDN